MSRSDTKFEPSTSFEPSSSFTFCELRYERERKEQDLKSLERKYNYNMRLLAKKKRERVEEMEKIKKREVLHEKNKLFSDHIIQVMDPLCR